MKKHLTLLLAVTLLLAAGCTPTAATPISTAAATTVAPTIAATPSPTATPVPTPSASAMGIDADLSSLLEMTREDVTALCGKGEPNPYGDISDYNETAYLLGGFPCTYTLLNGAMVFYDAQPMADDAAPYYCTEAPGDRVLGILLPTGSKPYHISGSYAALSAETQEILETQYDATIQHVNGLYEYYMLSVAVKGIQYTWCSDNANMNESELYVQLTDAAAQSAGVLTLEALALTVKLKEVSSVFRKDGTYRKELLYDGTVSIVLEGVERVDSDEHSITAHILALGDSAVVPVEIKKDTAVSTLLTYPAWRATYTTGANEDTRTNVDLYIQTDSMDYRFHTSTPADDFADYSERIESWIASLALLE